MRSIVVYSTKGGVGKTSLSHNLSKDLSLNYITNDQSLSALKLNKGKLIKNNIPILDDMIYDFGGFDSEEAYRIANEANLVIVPTICDMNAIARALSTIKKINHRNILVVATSIERKKDFEDVLKVFNHHYPDLKVVQFRRTKLLKNAIESGVSARSLNNDIYKKALREYNIIYTSCKEAIKE